MKKLTRANAAAPQLRPIKVLQFGSGNFLRAFTDWMIDILNEKIDFNGAIQIIQSTTSGKGDLINEQEGLYHVVINGLKNGKPFQETRLITSVNGALNPAGNYQTFLKAAENPDLKFIISNTTEVGITFNSSDNSQLEFAETFPGKLTALLFHRFTFFGGATDKGLIVMPCELIEKNGEVVRQVIHQYIRHWNLPIEFKQWVDGCNSFCNTLVDRIVPGFPKDKIKEIQERIGYEDKLVVMAEPFHLFVIEGDEVVRSAFPADKVGLQVKFVKDVTPYRVSKVRILNGAHTVMVPLAYLTGFRTVKDSIDDPKIGGFIRQAILEEIIPTLDLPKKELEQFAADVIERFQNPFVHHELMTIALYSISKFKVRVVPSIIKYIELKHRLPEKLLLSFAALIRFYKGDWNGKPIALNDTPDVLDFFKRTWAAGIEDVVHKILSNKNLWDADLSTLPGVEEKVRGYLAMIQSDNDAWIK